LGEQEETAVGTEGRGGPVQQVAVVFCGGQLDPAGLGRAVVSPLGEAVAVIGALGHGFASINTATQQTASIALTPAPWRATSSSISCSTAIRI
jgi:Zn-dependent alcohol dehydrogenase